MCIRDRDWLAVRQLFNAIDIVHALEVDRLPLIDLDDDLIGSLDELEVIAHCGGRHHVAFFGNAHGLNNGYLEVTVEALFYLLARVRQVDILVKRSPIIELLTQGGIGVIRRAEANRLSFRQNAIAVRGGGSAGEDVDLKFLALFM